MKNIYMIQASNTYTGNSFKAAYLPYAAGLLIAYAFTDETIKNEYGINIIFKCDEMIERGQIRLCD